MTTLANIRLAASPTTWGVDFADNPRNPAWNRVLDEMRQAVSTLSNWSGRLRGPRFSDRTRIPRSIHRGNLHVQPIFDDAREDEVLDVARRTSGLVRELNGEFLILVDQPTDTRVATAGRSGAATRMDDASRRRYLERVRKIGTIAGENGLRAVFHQHAGTNVEFLDEVEALFADVDHECLGMCLDTGHLAYAGIDPVSAIDHFSDRIDHVHFKDVNGRVLAQAREEGWDFWQAIATGIFCPIGEGVVDFPGVIGSLSSLGFSGTATIEQDRPPDSSTDPLADLRASVAHLSPLLSSDES